MEENKDLIVNYQLSISNFKIDIVRKSIKNMHLSVYPPTGRVRIAVPLNVVDETIRLFAISKLSWIKRNQRKYEKQERQSPRIFVDRESHYFQGRRYLLRVTEHNATPKVLIKTKTHIDLFVRPEIGVEQRLVIINEWYRKQLKNQIPELINKWEKIMEVSVSDWGVRQMKTKWGSCNIEQKRIWLNLELAKKSNVCLEYLIIHEMVHLLERNHNERFEFYMNKFLANWRSIKKELNKIVT